MTIRSDHDTKVPISTTTIEEIIEDAVEPVREIGDSVPDVATECGDTDALPTQAKTESADDNRPEIQRMILQKIGGFDLLSRRPVMIVSPHGSGDRSQMFVISGRHIRCYSAETGAFIDEYRFTDSPASAKPIIGLQRNEANRDELLVVSSDGRIVVWNYRENMRAAESFLNLGESGSSIVTFFEQIDNHYYFVVHKKMRTVKSKSRGGSHRPKLEPSPRPAQLYYCARNRLNVMWCVANHGAFINPDRPHQSVAFGPLAKKGSSETRVQKYAVTIFENELTIYQIPIRIESKSRRHTIDDGCVFRCVAFHPAKSMIATGDSIGRITLWSGNDDDGDLLAAKPFRTTLHWHSQAVNDLAFSPAGSQLYSVGNEKVLVDWNLVGEHFGKKSFFPRLGSPIIYVVANGDSIVTTHEDQTIHVIDSQMSGIRAVIEGLTAAPADAEGRLAAAGLHQNTRLGAIALNGRVGHVQLYAPARQKQLFQLDVTQQNVISAINTQSLRERLAAAAATAAAERDRKLAPSASSSASAVSLAPTPSSSALSQVFPIEVTRIAVSDDGEWMATVECRDDGETLPEIRLKFWLFAREFHLNTTVHLPHQKSITFIAFSPTLLNEDDDDDQDDQDRDEDDADIHRRKAHLTKKSKKKLPRSRVHLVTTSADTTFKIWDLHHRVPHSKDTYQQEQDCWWNCTRSASLNSYSVPKMAAFSADASLLTVLFGDTIVTVWQLDSPTTIRYIPRFDIFKLGKSKDILLLAFGGGGRHANCLIEGRHRSIAVRDVLRGFEPVMSHKTLTSVQADQWISMTLGGCTSSDQPLIAAMSRAAITIFAIESRRIAALAKIDFAQQLAIDHRIVSMIFGDFPADLSSSLSAKQRRRNRRNPFARSTFYCLNERFELFRAIPADLEANSELSLDDGSDSTLIGDVAQIAAQRTKLYMQRVAGSSSSMNPLAVMLAKKRGKEPKTDANEAEDNSRMFLDSKDGEQQHNVSIDRDRKMLIDKFFYNVPSHVLPPIEMIERSFLTAYMQCLGISSSPSSTLSS